ncbi:hypothetical protein IFM89_004633 [Coptis chinensis]|uniref:MADS-box domain-containing protein n=1 Tax=Coptis chinensis TaxID=261450 RepID=A0A835LH48_9MAGN|nr:hypothetical protein IFM89_004633 [Coptis chinensis]
MTRKKVKLAYIEKNAARKATLKKRMAGLKQKVGELTTLCGVKACALVYNPNDRKLDVWPNPSEAHEVLNRFKNLPKVAKTDRMLDQERFLTEQTAKMREQLQKQQMKNRRDEMTLRMNNIMLGTAGTHDLDMQDLIDLAQLHDERTMVVQAAIQSHLNLAVPPPMASSE